MSGSFYITTPIYYVNARPHLGHAYTTIAADVANRFHSMKGEDTYFLTGTDEHGDKIVRAAKKEQMTPREYVDMISGLFRDLWPELDIQNDQFIRTTDPRHIAVVEHVLQKIYDKGEIYFSEYEGKYCFGCERFYTDRELINGKCPDHETEPEIIKESNYFFRMSKYQDWLIDHIQKNPDFIRPERYRNEVLAFLREPLDDLCISRPRKRLQWGITLPFDENYVTYVWFDALINYISALGYPDGQLYQKYWPVAQHVIAKDILKPHGIYWPTMLKAAGIPIYQHLNVHGYWNVDESKMSKSIGNVVEPLELKNIYGLDAFRYFLMREMVFGLDANFSEDGLIQRINSDLANDIGNLCSRVLAMTHKYFGGVIPEPEPDVEKQPGVSLEADALMAIREYEAAMETFKFHKGLIAVWEFINKMNKYVDVMAPWELAKRKEAKDTLATVIYQLLEGIRVVAGLVYPIMPGTAKTMTGLLGLDVESPQYQSFYLLERLRSWGSLQPKIRIRKTISLFPRIDAKKRAKASAVAEPDKTSVSIPDIKPEITMETFAKIDLRVGTVVRAQPIPRAKKLLQLEVDLGENRTVVAGIAMAYDPDELVGKQVIVVANLKPAKLMGVLSKGMVIAATENNQPVLATLDKPVKPGTPLT